MSIDKRSGPRGIRYEVRYRAPDGRERSRTFRTRREAVDFEATQRTSLARGGWIDPRAASKSFDEIATAWLAANPSKRPSTLARDEVDLRCHLLPALRQRQVGSINPADVQALVNSWVKSAKPRTVRRRYGVLRAVLNYAVNLEVIARTPCRGINLPSAQPLEPRHLSDADLARLAAAMGAYGPMVYVGAVLGLRWGEVAGLRVGRLDLLGRRCSVLEQVTRGPLGAAVLGPPKSSAGRRTLSMPALLAELLAQHLAELGLTAADADAFVFPAPDGRALIYSNWRRRVWEPACVAAGLGKLVPADPSKGVKRHFEGLGFHDLRRTNATGLVAEGVDVRTAQERLGHSDPRLTLAVYAHATKEGDRAAADRLGERFMRPADTHVEESQGKHAG